MKINTFNWKNRGENLSEKKSKSEEISIPEEKLLSFMEQFLLEIDVQEASKKTYFKGLKNFVLWYKKKYTHEENTFILAKEVVVEYKNNLTKSSLKPHTQCIYLVSIKQFFCWTEANLIFPNITKNIKGIKKVSKQHHKDPLRKEDIQIILEKEYNQESVIEIRNHLLMTLLLLTGMRIGETTHIQLEDIESTAEKKKVIWIKGKGRTGKDSFIILLPQTLNIITQYLEKRKKMGEAITEKSYLFISHKKKDQSIEKMNTDSISRIVNTELKKLNIKTKRISPHSLRHSYGVYAIEAGVSLYDLQISMRHSTPTTTQVYLGDIEKMKRKEGLIEEIFFNHITKKNE